MCFTVWEEIIPSNTNQLRDSAKAGQPNPRFLDAQIFKNLVLSNCTGIGPRTQEAIQMEE